MVDKPGPESAEAIQVAIDALTRAEELILSVDRAQVLKQVHEIETFVDELSRYQVDIRLARIRLQSLLRGGDSDPDKTPVHGISSDKLRAVTRK